MRLPKFLNDILTGPDGETIAIGRVLAIKTTIAGIILPFWSIAKGQTIDWSGLGVLWGAIIGGATALIAATNRTEPPGNDSEAK